ncbi:DNA-binding transcriptional ArsR family regulator [Halarchaeum rubridurum]|uniref:DNA-binding transcriptional ArsR family regulator n=1 Tax=Halarchaeum rubridurum TaxID=489911 RepID=A0A830FZ90_9EURY|nr:hypothetical protein [Halarchaeum rubridurum]MBP1953193.1 DNA-binding transcriptional ArsR family regulator [Halarchaeum rubridurum]GGM67127.1 hypothetical protein GCM10009017_16620 [Halarchaeum rubridurum]
MSQARTTQTTDESTVSREEVFDLLSNSRRRHTLHYLRREERPVELRELSEQLSAWENDVAPGAVTHKQRKRVYTALRQTHLPRLDDADVIEYDANRGVVEPGNLEDVELYLDVVPENEIKRSEYYLGLSAVAAALLTVAWLEVVPFDAFPMGTWTALIVAAFALSAATDVYYDRVRRLGHDGPPRDIEGSD